MDTVDKEILKMILLEEEEDDEILSWFCRKKKESSMIHYLQRGVPKVITKYLSTAI